MVGCIGGSMASGHDLKGRRGLSMRKNVNVNELINRAKLDKNKERKTSLIVATVAISALVVTSYIISF